MHWSALAFLFSVACSAPTRHNLHHSMTKDEVETLLSVPYHRLHQAPQYDLTTPVRVTHQGDYVSHDLRTEHAQIRRLEMAPDHHLPLHFNFSAFGQTYHLEVKPDMSFISPGFFAEFRGNEPHRSVHYDTNACYFSGKVKSHPNRKSSVAIDNCNGKLRGVIATEDDEFAIQPLPDRLVRNQHTHIVTKRRAIDVPTDPPLAAPTCSGCKAGCCEPKASCPNCDRAFCCEPVTVECNTTNDLIALNVSVQKALDDYTNVTTRNEALGTDEGKVRVIEGFLVIDHVAYEKHGRDESALTSYVIHLMNIASSLYTRSELDFNFRLILKRILVLKTEQREKDEGLTITMDSRPNLESFSDWARENNPADITDPMHFDHAFLLTGNGMCFGRNEDCWELGRAWIGGICTSRFKASVNSDKGLQIGFVLAHELGHNLGMHHDGSNGRCDPSDGFLMTPSVSNAKQIHKFSTCSKGYLLDAIRNGATGCLDNCVADFQKGFGGVFSPYPGSLYTLDQQCHLMFPNTKFCSFLERNICEQLWCQYPDSGRCTTTYVGAAIGTSCPCPANIRPTPRDCICYNRQCRDATSVVDPLLPNEFLCEKPCEVNPPGTAKIHGQYGKWQDLARCSRTCGLGFKEQERKCDSPPPENCGDGCLGNAKRLVTCNARSCKTSELPESTRAAECMRRGVADGISDLVPDQFVTGNNECELICISKSSGRRRRYGNVPDGLRCNSVNNNRCWKGQCLTVGCDNVINSTAQFDGCGVCRGDNSMCTIHSCQYPHEIRQIRNAFFKIGTIPAGASRIRIEANFLSESILLVVRLKSGTVVGGTGSPEQTVDGAGTTFYFYRSSNQRQVLFTFDKNTTEEIGVEAVLYGAQGCHPGLTYSFITKPGLLPASTCTKAVWTVQDSKCSKCQGGTQTPVVLCRRPADRKTTNEKRCSAMPKPATSAKSCCRDCKKNTQPCPLGNFKWITKKFSECSRTCGGGIMTRNVVCRNLTTGKNDPEFNCCKLTKKSTTKSCNTQAC